MSSSHSNLPSGFPTSQLQTNLQSVQLLLSQTSALLRTLILACIFFNLLLFLSSFLTLGVRYIGLNTLFTSIISCVHTAILTLVVSPHIINSSSQQHSSLQTIQLDRIFTHAPVQYGNNPLAYGTVLGGTSMLVPLLQSVSTNFGGIASCVAHHGGYYHSMHPMQQHLVNGTSTTRHYFDAYGVCGSSGPVHFVSFLTSILSWLYLGIALLLFLRRGELLEGLNLNGGGGGGQSYQYDEIGESGGFSGDFPAGTARTMQV